MISGLKKFTSKSSGLSPLVNEFEDVEDKPFTKSDVFKCTNKCFWYLNKKVKIEKNVDKKMIILFYKK